jgi:hypothetical protein
MNLRAYKENFSTLCHKRLFQSVEYHDENLLEKTNLLTLRIRNRHFDALFLINVFSGAKCCPYVLETVDLPVPIENTRDFTMFGCSSRHCPSARCISAANAVCKSTGIFRNRGLNTSSTNLNRSIFLCTLFVLSSVILLLFYLYSCWPCNWPLAVEICM